MTNKMKAQIAMLSTFGLALPVWHYLVGLTWMQVAGVAGCQIAATAMLQVYSLLLFTSEQRAAFKLDRQAMAAKLQVATK